MQSPIGNQLWCPGQSLWSLISEHVPGSELPKIHAALGRSLVDVYTEVHSEAEMWHKMWQESQQGNNISRAGTPLTHQQGSLADPPAVKELVRAEVKMLLETLRERASREGRDDEEFPFPYKPETVGYALGHLDSCHRNLTSPEDTHNVSRPSSHCSVWSNAEAEFEAMKDKLNVTDIDQVVDRLKCVLMEECDTLNRLVKHLKGNIKQPCRSRCELDKPEPSLAELRELRGAVQMDLELYPSSLPASPSASYLIPLKGLKNGLPAGQQLSDQALRHLSAPSVRTPHPPSPLCHPKPRPPSGAPPNKTSTSVKQINSSSLSRAHGQHRGTPASRKPQTPPSTWTTTSGPSSDQKTTQRCSLSPERGSVSRHCRTLTSSPGCQIRTPRNSLIHESHPSSHHGVGRPSRGCDLSPQMGRKSSPAQRSRHIDTIPSSPHCDADSYSSNSTEHLVSPMAKSRAHNGRENSTRGGGLVTTTVQTADDKTKSTSESFHSCVGSRKSKNELNRNKTVHPGKDVTQQQSPVVTHTHPTCVRINGQFFTSPKRSLKGTTSQPKSVQEAPTELEFVKIFQPVPPARVST